MATVDDLGFSMVELIAALDNDEVRVQQHPDFPELQIFNYTEEVQFRNKWNPVTMACRGLILNMTTGEVVARPWKKFFNFGQRDNEIESTAPVEVTDKVDGSLGILYPHPKYKWAIATRGSFASEQALTATAMLHEKYRHDFDNWLTDNTYLFEIVYPENRIVVDYGAQRDLVLLGAVNKRHGYYLGPMAAQGEMLWNGPVVETFDYPDFVSALSAPDREGKEGIVIRSGNKIVKLKQADYVELHRIVTNLSPKTIWKMLMDGKTIAEICDGIPDEFHDYVKDNGYRIIANVSEVVLNAQTNFAAVAQKVYQERDRSESVGRRVWAEEIKKYPNKALLFMLLDNKDIQETAWKMCEPRGDVKILVKDEG